MNAARTKGLQRRLAAAAVLGFVLAGAARPVGAQLQEVRFERLEVRVSAHCPWPTRASKGFLPLFVDLENESDREHAVELVAQSENWDKNHTTTRALSLGPGESRRVELFVPAFRAQWGNVSIEVEVGRERRTLWGVYSLQSPGRDIHPIVVLTAGEPTPNELALWSSALAQSEYEEGGQRFYDASVAALPFGETPRRLEAYTSLDGVLVDTTSDLDPKGLAPVLAWARLGGVVAFVGPDAKRKARALGEVAPWMEERFVVEREGAVAYAFGVGRVVVADAPDFSSGAEEALVGRSIAAFPGTVPEAYPAGLFGDEIEIPGLGRLPYKLLILVLIGFAVLIGPVNFYLVRQANRPALLLLTIPLIAFVLSLGVLSYGIAYQGLDVKAVTYTYTLLDQRTHRSETIERRSFFAGLSPGPGLLPGPGTVCFPDLGGDSASGFHVELSPSPLYRGDFLPARQETVQTLVSERSARGRLAFARDASAWTVENGLGAPVERLVMRDTGGRLFVHEGLLAEGARGSLEPVAFWDGSDPRLGGVSTLAGHPFQRFEGAEEQAVLPGPSELLHFWTRGLPPGSYLARLKTNPFADDCGLEVTVKAQEHVVLGILASEELDG